MHFRLIDRVLERSDDGLVAIKQLSLAEEYLQDHFASFPVMPGVLMLEALVQAAREWAQADGGAPWVLGEVRALKYGSFVRPGDALRVEVAVRERGDDRLAFQGRGVVVSPAGEGAAGLGEGAVAVAGRFALRPARPWRGAEGAVGAREAGVS